MNKPAYLQTLVFLDGGDPAETRLIKHELGFLDGQTTNPSLVAKNPTIIALKESGQLTDVTIWDEYKKIALEIRSVLPEGAISVEVFADEHTTYDEMLAKAHELAQWFPGIFVKLPITTVGLKVAQTLVSEGICVNLTLCFSQEQAAAVHAATAGARRGQVFVSPFVGRLDDIGKNGIDLLKNITRMYQSWNSHVMVLGASIRNQQHLAECLKIPVDIITAPVAVYQEWKNTIGENPAQYHSPESELIPIPFHDIQEQDWVLYDIDHELTKKGLEKFAADWTNLFKK